MERVTRPCRACGEQIIVAPSPSGRTFPLQRVRNVYTLAPDGEARAEQFRDGVALYVSHWETCAKRDLMGDDGAHLGVGAERALKTILGGEPAPTEAESESVEAMRARILAAPIASETYDGVATACARLILEAWQRYPRLLEVPFETVYLTGDDGRMVLIGDHPADQSVVPLAPGLHSVLKSVYHGRPDALAVLSDLTGFMWGWAVNAALRCIDQPPAPNPALITVGAADSEA